MSLNRRNVGKSFQKNSTNLQQLFFIGNSSILPNPGVPKCLNVKNISNSFATPSSMFIFMVYVGLRNSELEPRSIIAHKSIINITRVQNCPIILTLFLVKVVRNVRLVRVAKMVRVVKVVRVAHPHGHGIVLYNSFFQSGSQ